MDTGVMQGALFPANYKEKLAANCLVRRYVLSLEEDTVFTFSKTRWDQELYGNNLDALPKRIKLSAATIARHKLLFY